MTKTSKLLIASSLKLTIRAYSENPVGCLLLFGRSQKEAEVAATYALNLLSSTYRVGDEYCSVFLGSELTISDVRSLQIRLARKFSERVAQIVVVHRFDSINLEAQNAMLKMLEEPADGTKYILSASDSGSVLPTIISRAQVWHVPPVSMADTKEAFPLESATRLAAAQSLARGEGAVIDQYLRGEMTELETAKLLISSDMYDRLVHLPSLTETKEQAIEVVQYIQKVLMYLYESAVHADDSVKAKSLETSLVAAVQAQTLLQAQVSPKMVLAELLAAL